MSYTPEQLLTILSNYEKLSDDSLLKNAKKQDSDKKKSVKPAAKKEKKDSASAKDSKSKKPAKKSSVSKRASLLASMAQKVQFHMPFMYLAELPYDLLVKQIRSTPPHIVEEYKREAERKFNDSVLPEEAVKFEKVLRAIKAHHNVRLLGPDGEDLLLQSSAFDKLIQKYSEENLTVERLISKYGQAWNPFAKQNPFKGISGETLAQTHADDLDQLHRSQQITDGQYNDAYKALHGTYPPAAAAQQDANKSKNMQGGAGGQLNLPNTQLVPATPVATNPAPSQQQEHGDKPNLSPARAPAKHAPAFNQEIFNVQKNLKHLGLTGADGKPLQTDGILGKNTKFAIQSYKTEYGMPNMSDKIAIYYILHPDKTKAHGYKSQIAGGAAPTKPAAPKPTGDGINDYWANNPNK